jgi:hypothetical protein
VPRAAVAALDAEEDDELFMPQPAPKKTTAMTIAQMTNVDFLFMIIETNYILFL